MASNHLVNLKSNLLIDPNFSAENGFWRSIKVFLTSYAGYDNLCPQLYQQKFDEYLKVMKELYSYANPDMNHLIAINNEVKRVSRSLTVAIKKVKGLDMADNLSVKIITIDEEIYNYHIQIDMTSEEQPGKFEKVLPFISSDDLIDFIQQNTQIRIRAIADNWIQSKQNINEFSIGFAEISAEGFEDWFDFGRGVQMLITIEIHVTIEPTVDYNWISKFHLHSIFFAIEKQFLKFNDSSKTKTTIDKMHSPIASKVKVSYIRKRINPNTEEAFWMNSMTSLSDVMQRLRHINIEEGIGFTKLIKSLKTVKFVDLQIPDHLYFNNEYEESVCLCSEWCNWNAFFHFNPIYRSLLVNHNQLFLQNKCNIPEMYLFSAAHILELVSKQVPLPNTPLLQLIGCANDYRKFNYNQYFLSNRSFQLKYQNSRPISAFLFGMSHKILLESIRINEIIVQLSTDPFANICCDSLINYYTVLWDLHLSVSMIRRFMDDKRKWFKIFYRISRNEYKFYITRNYRKCIDNKRISYDYLFTIDYEDLYTFVSTEQNPIKQIRDRVHQFSQPTNPLNIRVTLNHMTATYVSVYKFIRKVDPILQSIDSGQAFKDVFELCQTFDSEFNTFIQNDSFDFYLPLEERAIKLTDKENLFHKNLYIFYTLKLYYITFGLQHYCINSLIQWNDYTSDNFQNQVNKQFFFIFKNDIIEDKFRKFYSEPLFALTNDIQMSIYRFYNSFWGTADHERNIYNVNIEQCADSGCFQYQRLYFWWRNRGNDRKKFQTIIETFGEVHNYLEKRTEEIYCDYILSSIISIESYEYYLEVFDVLVYYLIKANCSLVFDTISQFLSGLHGLQLDELVKKNMCLSLTKPGFILLFKTMHRTFEHLNQMKQFFSCFDDENDRILKTLDETKKLVKSIYKDFYQKLSIEWFDELSMFYNCSNTSHQNITYYLGLHLASGLSFVISFIDDFRSDSNNNRKLCKDLLISKPNPNLIHQTTFHSFINGFENFLSDTNAINDGRPFLAQIWSSLLSNILQNWEQNTSQDVNIDMNDSDIV